MQASTSAPAACQHTLARAVQLSGVGLHRGHAASMLLLPAGPDCGVVFVRDDLPGAPSIVARADAVVDTTLCTTLAHPKAAHVRVQTIEHLLAALFGMHIDNCLVRLSNEEVPVLDGSAAPIVAALAAAGRMRQGVPRRELAVQGPLEVEQGERYARWRPPAPGQATLEVVCQLDFDHPCIPKAPFRYVHGGPDAFASEVAPARTWGFLRDLEALRQAGLARGGSLDNAVVFDEAAVKNPEGLRFADECARHKVLDALGDLMLAGVALTGRLELHRSGHGLHVALAKQVASLAAGAPA